MSKQSWIVFALVVSLGINLLFIGVVIGRVMSGPADGRPPLSWMMQDLSDETKQELRTSFREHMKETRPLRQEMRRAQMKLHELITAEAYDETAVIDGFAELRDQTETLQESMHVHAAKTMAGLAPEERVKILKFMANPRGRRGPPPPEG